jgi:hypothetical protein
MSLQFNGRYSEPEIDARVKDRLNLLQAKLTGIGVESHVATGLHWHVLIVDLPQFYRVVTVCETGDAPGKLTYCFETLRLEPDGEIFYRGPLIDEDIENLDDELWTTAQEQYKWSRVWAERVAELKTKQKNLKDTLNRIREQYPEHARDIQANHSPKGVEFSITIKELSEYALEQIILAFNKN